MFKRQMKSIVSLAVSVVGLLVGKSALATAVPSVCTAGVPQTFPCTAFLADPKIAKLLEGQAPRECAQIKITGAKWVNPGTTFLWNPNTDPNTPAQTALGCTASIADSSYRGCSDALELFNDGANNAAFITAISASQDATPSDALNGVQVLTDFPGAALLGPQVVQKEPGVINGQLICLGAGIGANITIPFTSLNNSPGAGGPSDAFATSVPAAPPAAYGVLALGLFGGLGLFVKRRGAARQAD